MGPRYANGDVSATPDELKSRIEAGIPGAVADVTGDGHHFNAIVTAAAFDGMPGSHSTVSSTTCSARRSGDRIHALSIQTRDLGNGGHPMSEAADQPDARGDPERDRREPRDPVHEGAPGRSRLCGFSAGPWRSCRRSASRSPPSTYCPTRGSARSSRGSRTGRRSRSCSSTVSSSAAATSSPRCTSRASWPRRSGSQDDGAPAQAPEAAPVESAPLTIENRL